MKESLIEVTWKRVKHDVNHEDDDADWYEISYDEKLEESLYVQIQGLDSGGKFIIEQCGYDTFNMDDYKIITQHIKKLLNPNITNITHLILNGLRDNGVFIVVIEIDSYKSNHPMDPEEWDMNVIFLGILGEQVKLVY